MREHGLRIQVGQISVIQRKSYFLQELAKIILGEAVGLRMLEVVRFVSGDV